MASLDSDKVDAALEGKLGCEVDRKKKDHNFFWVKENDVVLARTKISKGPKHTLSDNLVTMMARQLQLGVAGNLVKFVGCTLCKDDCLAIIRAASRTKSASASSSVAPAKTVPSGKPKP